MHASKTSSLLAHAARRAQTRSEYLGWILARYMEAEHKTHEELADLLSISIENLSRVQLCLRPRAESFTADLSQIACKFQLDMGELAAVIRYAEVVQGMKDADHGTSSSEVGLMMAARARRKNKQCRRRK